MAETEKTPTRRRLRSGAVILGGVGVLAAALTSCGSSEPDKRCVDPDSYNPRKDGYRILDSSKCKSGSGAHAGGRWYYDSERHGGYASDGHFKDGSPSSSSSGSSTGSSGGTRGGGSYDDYDADRGGFGDSSSGSGSGSGSGGG